MSLVNKLSRAFSKPPGVIAYRAMQEARIVAARRAKQFERLDREAAQRWSEGGQSLRQLLQVPPALLHANALSADRALWSREHDAAQASRAIASRLLSQGVSLFSDDVRIDGAIDWHKDWRTGYVYPKRFFKTYNHYGEPERPRDVKRPWELNRLAFLVPLAATAFIERDALLVAHVERILADWDTQNPYGYSVAWYPMEVSMRTLQLAVLLDLGRALERDGLASAALVSRLARLVELHGRFITLTLEYTDVRGNHYMANIAALAVAGKSLGGVLPAARGWSETAARLLSKEVPLQFLPDGVNFEKSLPYHRLVAELVWVAIHSLERAPHAIGVPLSVREVAERSIDVLAASRRCDGLVPNWGDNDDAKALNFDVLPSRQIDSVVLLAGKPYFEIAEDPTTRLSALWLNGEPPKSARCPQTHLTHFKAGGFAIARAEASCLFVDVGEVGLLGRGGHGHNDLTSFELTLGGSVLVVDPGCAVYTGDQPLRNRFRSTRSHNVLMINDKEMAALSGLWQIANTAQPHSVDAKASDEGVRIDAGHTGYDDVVRRYKRSFWLSLDGKTARITDDVEAVGAVEAVWRFHLAPGLTVLAVSDGLVELAKGNRRVAQVRAPSGLVWATASAPISAGYGHMETGHVLVAETKIVGSGAFSIEFVSTDASVLNSSV